MSIDTVDFFCFVLRYSILQLTIVSMACMNSVITTQTLLLFYY